MKTSIYRISRTFEAPRSFVYDWCTDFREDDARLLGQTWTRHIFEKSKRTVAWIVHNRKGGRDVEGIRIVSLNPKVSWHLLDYDDGINEVGDYRLVSEGRNHTRLDMVFRETFKTREPEPKSEFENRVAAMWDKYKEALEFDYGKSKKNSTARH